MKTKIVIENGRTEIVLTPENEFEQSAVDGMERKAIECSVYSIKQFEENKIYLTVKDGE